MSAFGRRMSVRPHGASVLALGGAVVLVGTEVVLGSWALLSGASDSVVRQAGDTITSIAVVGIFLSWTAVVSLRLRARRRQGKPIRPLLYPTLFFFGAFAVAAAGVIATPEVMPAPRAVPPASPADAFFLALYPLTIALLFSLPMFKPTVSSLQLGLEAAIIVVTIGSLEWYLRLGDLVLGWHGAVIDQMLGMSYALGDLLLLVLVLLIWMQSAAGRGHPALVSFGVSVVFNILSDALDTHGMFATLTSPVLVDVCTVASAYAAAVGIVQVWTHPEAPPRPAAPTGEPTGRVSLGQAGTGLIAAFLPYVALAVLLILDAHSWITPSTGPHGRWVSAGTYIATAIVIVLISVYQRLAFYEQRTLRLRLETALMTLERQNYQLAELASFDSLTGLLNRRVGLATLDHQIEIGRRYGRPCAVLFLDLDGFKHINDAYGHTTGDRTLRRFAEVVGQELRAVDQLCRWGGEEFMAILSNADGEQALLVAERIRAEVERSMHVQNIPERITCSIGVASYPRDAEDGGDLIGAADEAMYRAKTRGKNLVERAHSLP